jgi:hypothetical protein
VHMNLIRRSGAARERRSRLWLVFAAGQRDARRVPDVRPRTRRSTPRR